MSDYNDQYDQPDDQYDDPNDETSYNDAGVTPARGMAPANPSAGQPVRPQARPANDPGAARVSRVGRPVPPNTPPNYQADPYAAPRRQPDIGNAPRRPPRAPVNQRPNQSGNGLYLPWWSLLIMLLFVGGAAIGAWVIVSQVGGNASPGGGTPQVIVITATYTIGAPATQASISGPPTATATLPLPTIAASVTLPPGNFQIGGSVRVVGTGIGGLNVRPSPNLDNVPKFQAPDGTIFVLREGPIFANNTEWWRVEDPNDPSITGWGARNFLEAAG